MSTSSYWGKRQYSRRRLLATGGALSATAATAALVGCGDDDDGASTRDQEAVGTVGPAAQPKRGGNIVLAAGSEEPHHDVHQSADLTLQWRGSGVVYNRLLKRKLSPDYGGETVVVDGDLAGAWEQPDDTTYVFQLRPNIKWHNIAPVNGRALTANDVIYSVERQLALKILSGSYPGIEHMEAADSSTVRFRLGKPNADFVPTLTSPNNKIVAREAVDLKGDLKEGPVVGTGAWILKDSTPNNTMKFERNPSYFLPGLPYADTLEFPRIADPSTNIAAFRSRRINALVAGGGTPTNEDVKSLRSTNPEILVALGVENTGLGTNVTIRADVPPTNDVRVRQALSKALDRQQMIDTIFGGLAVYNAGLMSAVSSEQLLPEEDAKRLLARDLSEAKRLMQQAGVPGFSIDLTFGLTPTSEAMAELAQVQLRDIGVTTNLKPVPNLLATDWLQRRNLNFVINAVAFGIFGPNAYCDAMYRSGGSRNMANVNDAEMDRLIDAQRSELADAGRRNQLLHEIQRRTIELAGNTPVMFFKTYVVTWPEVRGIYLGQLNEPGHYELIWFDR